MKKLIVLLAVAVLPAAGCTAARAHIEPEERPALLVPPVPPRAIEPMPSEPQTIQPVPDLPEAPAAPPRTRPPAPNRTAAEPKPENKTETPPETAVVQPVTPPPVPVLRTPGTAEEPQIREIIERAGRLLKSIDANVLRDDRRANYEHASNFLNQADEALKKNDLVLAKNLAERAEQIAKLLAGR